MNRFQRINAVTNIFMPFIKPYKWGIIGAVVMVIITNLALAFMPTVEGNITSQLVNDVNAINNHIEGAGVDFSYLLKMISFLVLIFLIKTISQVCIALWLTNSIQNAMHDIRNALLNKIRKLPVSYFDTHQYGDILSKITNDIDTLSTALQQSFTQIISGFFSIVLALVMMYRINFIMASIATLIIPLSLLVTFLIVRVSQKRFRAQQDALGKLNAMISETYGGYNEIMLFNRQEKSIDQFIKVNDELRKNAFKAQFVSASISPLNALVTYLVLGITASLGTIFAISNTIKVGQLQAFIRYIWQINDPISQISQLSSQIQAAFAASARVRDILVSEEEVKEQSTSVNLSQIRGDVSFDHIKFGYQKNKVLIKDLNVNVKSGQMVAIVGPTGAGKTTLINLLMRFYDVDEGNIKIDGVDIRTMRREDLRSLFGMVLQDTWLFSGTIYDNLKYGRLDARKDEVIEAAKMANVHHYIRTLPDGYNMQINEEASNISQGEKQLLTIARAILKNPRILILDEATSSVDTRLEKMLQDAMHKVMEGRTSFVIAHRLSTIRNADLILVIKEGNIVEQGTHETLLAQKGYYESLYNSQFEEM